MKTAVVLFNLGGPDSPQAVRPFLFNLFNDPAIIGAPGLLRYLLAHLISARRSKVARAIYDKIGGRSPILTQTDDQARALDAVLNASGSDPGAGQWKSFVCMRYWHPRAEAVVRAVKEWQPDRVLLLPLYPQFSTTTTASSLREWYRLAIVHELVAPTQAVCCWPVLEGFVAAVADLTQPRLAEAARHGRPRLLFSAHGLPEKIVKAGDPYAEHVLASARAIAARLGLREEDAAGQGDWLVCFQSRVGPLKWLGPYTDQTIIQTAEAKRPIVIVPLAFVSEHSETLVELDIEYRHLAQQHGAPAYLRVPTAQTHPAFIAGLVTLARQVVGNDLLVQSAEGRRRCSVDRGACPIVSVARALATASVRT
jgi:ferrochelatase